jgi:hypothetical protein
MQLNRSIPRFLSVQARKVLQRLDQDLVAKQAALANTEQALRGTCFTCSRLKR